MTPTRMWVAEVNGRSVGFVQDYRIGDYPEYAVLGPDPERDRRRLRDRRRRLDAAAASAPRLVWAWMQRARASLPRRDGVLRGPGPPQPASLRMLAKLGFTEGLWFDEPQEDGTVDTVVGCTLDVTRGAGLVERHDCDRAVDCPASAAARTRRPLDDRDRRHPRLRRRQGGGQDALWPSSAPSSPTCRSGSSPSGPTGSPARRPAGAAGHGHLRQGRRAPAHRRAGRPAGREDHRLQGTDRGGAEPRLPVADPPRRCPSPATSASSTARTTRTC